MKWEYYTARHMSQDVLDSLGEWGWELVNIYGGVAYFKRPKEDYGEQEETLEEEDKEAASQEDAAEQQVNHQKSHIGELYSRAYE